MSLVESSLENFNNNKESKFLDKLTEYFTKEEINKLSKCLSENNAIIAGGSVLSSFSDFHMNDMDIYVNFDKVPEIYNTLMEIGYKKINLQNISPAYDQSFFRKNNIMYHFNVTAELEIKNFKPKRYYYGELQCNLCSFKPSNSEYMKYHLYDVHNLKYIDYYNKPVIDLLIVPEGYDTKLVAQNFDLSFCEIWFDGVNTYAVDIEGITNKRGILKPDYVDSLLKYFNKFILRRIKKYLRRGFDIKYDISQHMTLENAHYIGFHDVDKNISHLTEGIGFDISDGNGFVYPEEWVVKYIFREFLSKVIRFTDNNFYMIYKFLLKKFTIIDLFKVIGLYYHICDPYMWHIYCMNDVRTAETEEEEEQIYVDRGTFEINKEDRKYVDDPKTFEPEPEIEELRINKKIKYIICLYILSSFHGMKYMPSNYIEYFEVILNFDAEVPESPYYISTSLNINTEEYDREDDEEDEIDPVNSIGYDTSVDNELLSKIIFDNTVSTVTPAVLSRFYSKLNIRNEFYLKTGNISNITNMEVYDTLMGYDRLLVEFLEEDKNNIIFIYNTKNGYKAEGITKSTLCDFHSKLVVECKTDYTRGTLREKNTFFDSWYFKLGLSINYYVSLDKINLVIDELQNENSSRIFYIKDMRSIDRITFIDHIEYYGDSTNIMGIYGNCISGTKCSPGSVSYFFDEVEKIYLDKEIVGGSEETKESSYLQEEKEDGRKNKSKKKKKKSKKRRSRARRSRSRRS